MDKERLERAKKIIKDMVRFIENVSHIGKEDTEYLDWLLKTVEEQVERVQELEEVLSAHITEVRILKNANRRIKQKNKQYREALEFYASRNNYESHTPYKNMTSIDEDNGEKARQALKIFR